MFTEQPDEACSWKYNLHFRFSSPLISTPNLSFRCALLFCSMKGALINTSDPTCLCNCHGSISSRVFYSFTVVCSADISIVTVEYNGCWSNPVVISLVSFFFWKSVLRFSANSAAKCILLVFNWSLKTKLDLHDYTLCAMYVCSYCYNIMLFSSYC